MPLSCCADRSEGFSLVDNALYHVMLDGRRVGPYDRRTIVGMRIKKTLTSEHVLIGANGSQLTVRDLVRRQEDGNEPFEPSRSGSYSVVQAVHSAWLAEVQGRGFDIPAFKGEVEVRVQTKALRIAGRYRSGFGWKEGRIKVPVHDVVHARLRGSVADIWLRHTENKPLQRLGLELFTPESAAEFVQSLPHATPWTGAEPRKGRPPGAHPLVWGAIIGSTLLVGGILVWALTRPV